MRLWGGRFSSQPDELMRRFNDSFSFDQRLYAADIKGSVAYAHALERTGLLTRAERVSIVEGLERVKVEFDEGRFEALPGDEDIHTAIERRLTELIGGAARKLHTGRSRNDQVALDLRLWLLDAIDSARGDLATLEEAIIAQAEAHLGLIMPGYTHLQPAQPVLFSHWLMSYFWMFERDRERLADCAKRANLSPLGASALAGNPFMIDREALAVELGMAGVTANSMDAVSDRDHAAEFLFAAALIGVHISRLAEDLILFSSPAQHFIRLDETYMTGSSLMPQKRNPDSLELARGKSGRLNGNLITLLTVLKGLPSTYNKDMQEDKEPLFDASETLDIILPVVSSVVRTLKPDEDAMHAAMDEGMLATDLADYLVRKGTSFREAHHIVGRLVKLAEERAVSLAALPLTDLQAESVAFGEDASLVFNFEQAIAKRNVTGGTAPDAVRRQIARAKEKLNSPTS
jgi:argininosuccinate lyase